VFACGEEKILQLPADACLTGKENIFERLFWKFNFMLVTGVVFTAVTIATVTP